MNILILNWKDIHNPSVGGAEIILYELAKRWVNNGHKVTWFCRSFSKKQNEDLIDGIHIVRRGGVLTTYILAYFYYKSLIVKPDIVIDVLNTIFWQTPLYIEKKRRIAYVNQLAKEVLFYELPPIISQIAYILEKIQFISYRNSKILCYAKSTKEDLVKEGIPRNNINLFSVGIDHSRYKIGKKAQTPLIIVVNRLVRMKRTELVLHAMKSVLTKFPKTKLAIVGYGYDRERLGKLRDNLKLNNNVFFVDENMLFFNKNIKDQKIQLMQKAWALVFPSVKEGWGMTVTECAACGTPAIVTDVTGLVDAVIAEKTGLVIPKNPTKYELSEAIIRIIENDHLRRSLSTNARVYSLHFNWEKTANKVFSLISH